MSRAWLGTAGALSAGSLLLFGLPPPDAWALGAAPWSVLTAGLAHWNALHLGGNLLGLAVLALLGQRAGLGTREALAWLLAGPICHAMLLAVPELPPYAGLSGWLHAGVVVAAVALWRQGQRTVGAAIALGLAVKLALEAPWGPWLRPNDWWGGATVPVAHAAGALAGLVLSAATGARARPAPPPPRRAG